MTEMELYGIVVVFALIGLMRVAEAIVKGLSWVMEKLGKVIDRTTESAGGGQPPKEQVEQVLGSMLDAIGGMEKTLKEHSDLIEKKADKKSEDDEFVELAQRSNDARAVAMKAARDLTEKEVIRILPLVEAMVRAKLDAEFELKRRKRVNSHPHVPVPTGLEDVYRRAFGPKQGSK